MPSLGILLLRDLHRRKCSFAEVTNAAVTNTSPPAHENHDYRWFWR
jgi:hypothetical protein